MWLRSPLDDILSSRTKLRLLRTLAMSPTPLTGHELARLTGAAQGNVSVILKQFVASGIVEARVVQPAVEFRLRAGEEPVLASLRALFEAEQTHFVSAVQELSAAIPELVSLVLFGSAARGTHRSDSDTDLLIVIQRMGDTTEQEISGICQQVAERHLLGLSWIVRDRDGLRQWIAEDNTLWQNIRDDGVVLFGQSIGELAR
jgi:DNA-binding transcriptional ArsR family regulator